MSEKNNNIKKEINKNNSDVILQVSRKIDFFKDIIQKTLIHVQTNKIFDILGISDINNCIERLEEINRKMDQIFDKKKDSENLINNLQIINDDLSGIIKNYGTKNFDDLIVVCFGNNNKIINDEHISQKFDLLKKYFHPTSYKVINKKEESKNKKNSDNLDDNVKNLDCFDVSTNYKQFYMKVYGLKIFIHSEILKKSLVVYGVVDDVMIDFLNNEYIFKNIKLIKENKPSDEEFNTETFDNFVSSLTLKDFLIYDNNCLEIYNKFMGCISQNNSFFQKQMSHAVKEFISDDLYTKRNIIIQLLLKTSNYENLYSAYLLYELLSNDSNGNIDTQEQIILFDSFPWSIKKLFNQAMKKTIQYTNELSNFDINKIPLEQQICLLKASDSVKEKAMMKLKEVKAKSEDSGSKARQYLDGLLKIPFSVYKCEPILNMMDKIRSQFKDLYKKYDIEKHFSNIPSKEKYTNIEILNYIKQIKELLEPVHPDKEIEKVVTYLIEGDKKKMIFNIVMINETLKKFNLKQHRIKYHSLNKDQLKDSILSFIELCKKPENKIMLEDTIKYFIMFYNLNKSITSKKDIEDLKKDIYSIDENIKQITDYMNSVKDTLDNTVYGHDKAKKQIERVIGQWINSENKKNEGHVLGFEGNPGIGKTTLAKGLSECLKDENGNPRPFALIPLGGDANASTLVGHSYTYVGSTFGSLVQILMDKRCMNPIILFDEVDKISKTEHGKEITGILTHLLDPTQNNCFQDKYFSGIDLDLSKVLFILSYNDVNSIDKILLDRVHRIKFDSLSVEDKIVISKKHLLPEIYKNIGLDGMIEFSDEVIKFIIEEYTLEPGVRKLKEKLFEIIGEINLNILKNSNTNIEIPIHITIEDIKNKYFKDKREVIIKKVPEQSLIGYANGMYATANSIGGTLPIHAKFFPCENFLELKLTGLQQEVMRESMHVSLTVAWNLTSEERRKILRQLYDGKSNKYGINLHPSDSSVQKDGPSAGITITSALYSLLNDIPIKPKFAMTGEIEISGNVSAIGGLNHKILGSIKAGVKEFIFPKDNKKDFEEFYEKYKNDHILDDIKFHPVEHINEVLELILEK